eukprot:1009093-Pelagomonas_calceolata.AAC.3
MPGFPRSDHQPSNTLQAKALLGLFCTSKLSTDGQPNIPLAITTQAACIYETKWTCADIVTLNRLQILIQAYTRGQAGWNTRSMQPTVQKQAAEIMGLLYRFTSYIGKGDKKLNESNTQNQPQPRFRALYIEPWHNQLSAGMP